MKNYLKEIREEKGISLTKLSKLCSLTPGYLCHLEKRNKR